MIYIDNIKESAVTLDNVSNGINWKEIGIDYTPSIFLENINISEKVYNEWNPANTSASFLFSRKKIAIAPKIDTHNVTEFDNVFNGSWLIKQPEWDFSNGENFEFMFFMCIFLFSEVEMYLPKAKNLRGMFAFTNLSYPKGLKKITIYTNENELLAENMNGTFLRQNNLRILTAKNGQELVIKNVVNLASCFEECDSLQESPTIYLDNCEDMKNCFKNCRIMKKIWLIGNTSKLTPTTISGCFDGLPSNGTLYVGLQNFDANYNLFAPELNKDGRNWDIVGV